MTNSNTQSAAFESGKHLIPGQKVLGRFTLKQILGQGGMGVVWLASDDELNRDVALKFLPSVVVNDWASLNDLKRETKRSLELTHPHIVRTYDFVQGDSIAGISMEYVDSNTLRHRRVAQPGGIFEPAQLGDWTKQLCDALDYAHHHAAIVHRDLKPANLMVNAKNHLKVADFGISRSLVESITQVSGLAGGQGTLVYMSPQQLIGEQPHPTDDVYAIGATLFDLCTTRPPFFTGDISAQVRDKAAPSIAQGRTALGVAGGEIPENWETTVAACLAKDPMQRPQSAGEVAVRLGLKPAAEIANYQTSFPLPAFNPPSAGPVRVSKPGPPTPEGPTGTGFQPTVVVKQPRPKANPAPFIGAMAAVLVGAVVVLWIVSGKAPSEKKQDRPYSVAPMPMPRPEPEKPTPVVPDPQPAPPAPNLVGSLYIATEPRDALVSVDHKAAEKTPWLAENLAPGTHTLKITKPGYDDVEETFEIAPDKPLKRPAIPLVPSTGWLTVDSNDPTATITVKYHATGQIVGGGPGAWKSDKLPVGTYDVTLSKGDWTTTPKQVTVERGRETPQVLDAVSPGVITFSNPTPGVKVKENGKEIGKITDQIKLAPGKHTLSLAGPAGVKDADRIVMVPPGETITVDGILEKKDVPKAPVVVRQSSGSGRSNNSGSRDRDRDGDGGGGGGSAWDKASKAMGLFRGFRGY